MSADGCQFALTGPRVVTGDRLAFTLASAVRVSGTVRWVIEDRIGFAFDGPLAREIVAELSSHHLSVTAVVMRRLAAVAQR